MSEIKTQVEIEYLSSEIELRQKEIAVLKKKRAEARARIRMGILNDKVTAEVLSDYVAQGMLSPAISKKLGISLAALEACAKRLGVDLNAKYKSTLHRAAARYREALKLRGEGLTYKEIGKHFGVSAGRAGQLVDKGERLERSAARHPR